MIRFPLSPVVAAGAFIYADGFEGSSRISVAIPDGSTLYPPRRN